MLIEIKINNNEKKCFSSPNKAMEYIRYMELSEKGKIINDLAEKNKNEILNKYQITDHSRNFLSEILEKNPFKQTVRKNRPDLNEVMRFFMDHNYKIKLEFKHTIQFIKNY